jgi:hypothetical protein
MRCNSGQSERVNCVITDSASAEGLLRDLSRLSHMSFSMFHEHDTLPTNDRSCLPARLRLPFNIVRYCHVSILSSVAYVDDIGSSIQSGPQRPAFDFHGWRAGVSHLFLLDYFKLKLRH